MQWWFIMQTASLLETTRERWRKDQANLFDGEIKLSANRKMMGCLTPKYPELDQRMLKWFTEQAKVSFLSSIDFVS